MRDFKSLRILGLVFLLAGFGLLISALVGSLFSLVSTSALEGFYAGILLSGMLLVLVYFFIIRKHGTFRRKSWLFEFHSILGLVTGIFLGVIFLTGTLLLYRAEIEVIENPWLEIKAGDVFKPVDAWIDAVKTRSDLNTSRRIDITWPENRNHPVSLRVIGPNGSEQFYVDPYNARMMDGAFRSRMNLVRRLHVGLNLGTPGHWLAGLVALLAIWLCISGLTMGRNVFRKFYVLRWRNGLAIFLSDLHKRLGLWLLPFIALNAFAGMIAALFGVFSFGPIEARFDGDYNALYTAVGSPQSVPRSENFSTPSISQIIATARKTMPNAAINQLRIIGYGDRNAIVSIRASRKGDFSPQGSSLLMNIRASTGEILLHKDISKAGHFEKLHQAFAAFHFASYGGTKVRLMHAVTALIITLLPLIGFAMWYLRRRRRMSLN